MQSNWLASSLVLTSSGLTLSILRGEDGPAVKELRRLLQFMKTDVRHKIAAVPSAVDGRYLVLPSGGQS